MYYARCRAFLTCMLAAGVLLLALAVPARAMMMRHHDLASLVVPARMMIMRHHDLASLAFEADAIVVAERTGGPDNAAAYRVVKVLAGQGLHAGDAITIDQTNYVTDRRSYYGAPIEPAAPVEPIAILFLEREATHPSEPAWSLLPSGLRIFAGGRAYRFEHRNNPGLYQPVPQGRDPEDAYGVETSVHWDRAELEHAIASAVERADLARAAIAARDPVRILALLPANLAVDEPWDDSHFYEDRIAVSGFYALIDAGEIDGALDVYTRIHGLRPWRLSIGDSTLPGDSTLLARAESSSAPLPRRIAALSLLDMLPSDDTLHRLFAIARDESAPTALRVAATRALAGEAQVSTSEPRRQQLTADLRSLVRELAPRTLGSLRVELVACAERLELKGAVPVEYEIVASATLRDRRLAYRVVAAPGVNAMFRDATLLRSDGTACDAKSLGTRFEANDWTGRVDAGQCPEASQLRIEVQRDGRDHAWTIPVER